MGCFSWMFADTDNRKPLNMNESGYLVMPDGTLLHEPSYEGYGEFAGQDVYALVADWNREFLSQNPNFIIKQHEYINDDTAPGGYRKAPDKKVSDFLWYAAYADLTKSREEVVATWLEAVRAIQKADPETRIYGGEWRSIGLAIACYDDQNAALLYPIKVCERGDIPPYQAQTLIASMQDPNQGFGGDGDY